MLIIIYWLTLSHDDIDASIQENANDSNCHVVVNNSP